jgi:NADH/NAD ratio-sensing transcriptional regulator Rex
LGDQILKEKKIDETDAAVSDSLRLLAVLTIPRFSAARTSDSLMAFLVKKKIGYMPCYLINPEKVRNTC